MTTSKSELPVLLVTLGDPAGVGPEVTVRGVAEELAKSRVTPVVVGDARVVRRAAEKWTPELTVNTVESPREADSGSNVINVLDLPIAIPKISKLARLLPIPAMLLMSTSSELLSCV